jgi:hypothetical protein
MLLAFRLCLVLYIHLLPTIGSNIHLLWIIDRYRHTVAPQVPHLTHSVKGKAARGRRAATWPIAQNNSIPDDSFRPPPSALTMGSNVALSFDKFID